MVSLLDGRTTLTIFNRAGSPLERKDRKRPKSGGIDRGQFQGRHLDLVSVGDFKPLALSNALFWDTGRALTLPGRRSCRSVWMPNMDLVQVVQFYFTWAASSFPIGPCLGVVHCRRWLFCWSAWVCRYPSSPVSRLACSSLLILPLSGNIPLSFEIVTWSSW